MPKTKSKIERMKQTDLRVERDGDGNLVPVEVNTKLGSMLVLPMVYGDAELFAKQMKNKDDVDTGEVAKVFAKHVVDPDLSEIRGDEIKEDYKPLAVAEILKGIMKASGLEEEIEARVNEDGTLEVEVKNT